MKVSLFLVVCLALQSCLPANLHEANVCDSVPAVSVASGSDDECCEEKREESKVDKADKTLMMYRMLHAF